MLKVGAFLIARRTRVTPQQVIDDLIFCILGGLMTDFDGSFDCFDLAQARQGGSDSSVHAQDLVFNQSGQGHLFEKLVDLAEERKRVIDVLFEEVCAVISETH